MVADSAWAEGPSRSGVGSQAREDARDALRAISRMRLTGGRWEVVEQAVAALGTALAAGDSTAFSEAVCDVEQDGPLRGTGLGDEPTVPAPERVLERINVLIHTMDGSTTSAQRTADDNADS
ncbi:MAG: CATRA system-associated protein [Pseudonocardiaceae bacterium]